MLIWRFIHKGLKLRKISLRQTAPLAEFDGAHWAIHARPSQFTRPDTSPPLPLMNKPQATALLASSLVVTPVASATTTVTTPAAIPATAQNHEASIQNPAIGSEQWNRDIEKLLHEGTLTEISHSPQGTTYAVHDKKNKTKTLGTFTLLSPSSPAGDKTQIGGKFEGVHPAVIFNQTDQKALQSGGVAGVTAMAAAWAAVLSETVIGSVISAGVITAIGGAAAVYVSQHGVCPGNKSLIVPLGKGAHCE